MIREMPNFRLHIERKSVDFAATSEEAATFVKTLYALEEKDLLLTCYGSFRHWGHPYIRYLEGLESLYQNVTQVKEIDETYDNALASDFTFKVIKVEFRKKGTWPVDSSKMETNHPLAPYVKEHQWPPGDVIQSVGDRWPELPIMKCWDIPDVVDPSQIYSDKTHSIYREELIRHLRDSPGARIPSRKVLDTLLKRPETNWREFLKDINENGIPKKHKVIGLKAKEREIKEMGRFFALMSWKLREYFVFTELMIKQFVIPLFDGLTMADDQNTVIKKMMDSSSGQGGDDYEYIGPANHLDYQKWNNHQRKEATSPTFRVIGQFFGLAGFLLGQPG